jgi:hypothetical protein
MEKNNNNFLLVLRITLTVYLLIALSFIQSSIAQRDEEDNGWWDPREEYYNYSQSDRLKGFY